MADKPLVWLAAKVKTPPFSAAARLEAGTLLRKLQRGDNRSLPYSRPMREIGKACHEIRLSDGGIEWRIVYRIDEDAIVVIEIFQKKSQATRQADIERCRRRLKLYDKMAE